MISRIFPFCRLPVAIVMMVALLATGFGHRHVDARDIERLHVLAASGMSPADLCGDWPDDGTDARGGCDACLVVALAAPPVSTLADPVPASMPRALRTPCSRIARPAPERTHPPRAPPA